MHKNNSSSVKFYVGVILQKGIIGSSEKPNNID
jgi:hypothetical protein